MATAVRITKGGNRIVAEVQRMVTDNVAYADGDMVTIGRTISEHKIVRILDAQGKVLVTGYGVVALTAQDRAKAPAGVVGTLGRAWITSEAAALIAEAMAEAEAAPKSDEYVAIEQAAAKAKARTMRRVESESEKLQRRMDDPDSDL